MGAPRASVSCTSSLSTLNNASVCATGNRGCSLDVARTSTCSDLPPLPPRARPPLCPPPYQRCACPFLYFCIHLTRLNPIHPLSAPIPRTKSSAHSTRPCERLSPRPTRGSAAAPPPRQGTGLPTGPHPPPRTATARGSRPRWAAWSGGCRTRTRKVTRKVTRIRMRSRCSSRCTRPAPSTPSIYRTSNRRTSRSPHWRGRKTGAPPRRWSTGLS